ncbi:MAG: beta-galactosidase, partial [Chloroflexota bacterium]
MRLGVAWYPEQHPPERWADDTRRMARAGLELVRLGEFAWAVLEPSREQFRWAWLDRAIDSAAEAGLRVVLGTPTAVPPVWLLREEPEILSVGPDGQRRAYGSRRFNCPTAPAYRDASRRIVEAMARRYGSHPAIVAWQLDNEPGNHDSARCWCDHCEKAFHAWLRERYGTIDALNRAWGTVFWSGTYPDFEAVRLPRATNAAHSPSLLLAHRRFSAGQSLARVGEQRAIVAAEAPGRTIFANLPATEIAVDGRPFAGLGGVAAINLYPTGMGTPEDAAYLLDLARGHTGRVWVMEHQPGPINWTPTADPVPPGQVRLWGWRAALHGVETFLFFSWRPSRSGSEQYHSGLLRHDGSADRGL